MTWLISQALMKAYENSHCLPVPVAEYSAANCLDGELSAPSSGNPTPQAYLLPVKTTDAWSRFPSGITLSPLTESRGQDVLTWFLEGFPARTLVQPEKAQESTESAAECGEKWHGSLAKYDPDSSSWKTAQCLLLGGLEQFSETWPRWGLMRNGECWEAGILERLTEENEYGFLPTPKKQDSRHAQTRHLNPKDDHWKSNLGEVFVAATACKKMPADFVEALMGWPIDHTALRPLETAKFQQWLQQHGECLEGQ